MKSLNERALVAWFKKNKRLFPWRLNRTPYKTWICEMMSHQSTLKTVVPRFENWMAQFPDRKSVAKASEKALLKAWEGLGYYARVRHIQKAAQILENLYPEGQWPQSPEAWMALPGVGPYSAKAIMALAFDHPVLPLDGNVVRVVARWAGVRNPLNDPREMKKIQSVLEHWQKHLKYPPSQVAEALMELGATCCRSIGKINCANCPLSRDCWSLKHLKTEERIAAWPRAKKRPQSQKWVLLCPLYYRSSQKTDFVCRQIPPGRRLAGQWELPYWQMSTSEFTLFKKKMPRQMRWWGPVSHQITTHSYRIWACEAGPWKHKLPKNHKFLSELAGEDLLTTLSKKIIKKVDNL